MCVLVAILAILNVIGFRYSTIHGSKLTEKRFSYLRVFFVGTVRPCVKVFSCEDFMVLGLQVRRMRRMTRDAWLNAGDLIPQACRRCTKCARCVGADMFCTFANIVNVYKCVHLFAHWPSVEQPLEYVKQAAQTGAQSRVGGFNGEIVSGRRRKGFMPLPHAGHPCPLPYQRLSLRCAWKDDMPCFVSRLSEYCYRYTTFIPGIYDIKRYVWQHKPRKCSL